MNTEKYIAIKNKKIREILRDVEAFHRKLINIVLKIKINFLKHLLVHTDKKFNSGIDHKYS
jgi:hypothetical protein